MDPPSWSYGSPQRNFQGSFPNKRNAIFLGHGREFSSGLPGSSLSQREGCMPPLQSSIDEWSTDRTRIVGNLQEGIAKRILGQHAPTAGTQTSHPRFLNSAFHDLTTRTGNSLGRKPKSCVPGEPISLHNISVEVPLSDREQLSYGSFTEQRNDPYPSNSSTSTNVVQATNDLPILDSLSQVNSAQCDTISSKLSCEESNSIVSTCYLLSTTNPLQKTWTTGQLAALEPSLAKQSDVEHLGNFINSMKPSFPQDIIRLPEKSGYDNLPNLNKASYFDQRICGLTTDIINHFSNGGSKFFPSSLVPNGSDVAFHHPPLNEVEPSSTSTGNSFNSRLVDGILKTDHDARLMGGGVSGASSGNVEVLTSNNKTHSSKVSNLANLDQQTPRNVIHFDNVSHIFPREFTSQSSNDKFDKPEQKKIKEGLPHVLSNEEGMHNCLEGKTILATERILWDGSLQLNASVTVAAVAYFKSGDQNLNIDWPDHIEVKGRVRLEAFEKFIQDLPRSRNRSLMVVSLCRSVRSLDAELIGMEKVSKSYEEGKRVGFAELSSGIDLYICPRSEVVITILAKYGFYKGMATVRDKESLLIGCVIWRKRHGTSTALQKTAEKRKARSPEKAVDSPSSLQSMETESQVPSSRLRTDHSSLLPSASEPATNLAINENIQGPSVTAEAGGTMPHKKVSEVAKISTSKEVPKVSLSLPISLPESSLISDARIAPSSSSMIRPDFNYLQSIVKLSAMGEKTPDSQAVLQRSIAKSGREDELKIFEKQPHEQILNDDDDLPEFDFSVACGPPKCTTLIGRVHNKGSTLDVHNPADVGTNKMGDPAHSCNNSYVPLHPKESEVPKHPVSLSNNIQGVMLNAMKNSDIEASNSVPSPGKPPVDQVRRDDLADRSASRNPLPASVSSLRKLWDDEDDSMPEWRPPYLEQGKPLQLPPPPPVRSTIPPPSHPTVGIHPQISEGCGMEKGKPLQLLPPPPIRPVIPPPTVVRLPPQIPAGLLASPANRPLLPLPISETPLNSGNPRTFQTPSEYTPSLRSCIHHHGNLPPFMPKKEPIRPKMDVATERDRVGRNNPSEAFGQNFKSKFEAGPSVKRKGWTE